MSKLEQITQQVEALEGDELKAFASWFEEFRADQWDRQIAADVEAGKLDKLIAEAEADIAAGRLRLCESQHNGSILGLLRVVATWDMRTRRSQFRAFEAGSETPEPALQARKGTRMVRARRHLVSRSALEKPEAMNWFWIGHHAEYDRLIR